MGKKLLNYSVVIFIIYFVAFRPGNAAKVARGLGGLVAKVAVGFGDFFSGLIS